MSNLKKITGLFSILIIFFLLFSTFVRADELEEINKQIADLSKALEMSKSAAAGVQKSLKPIQDQIDSIQKRIDNLAAGIKSEENKITKLEASITKRELELNDEYVVLASHIRKFYIRKSFDNPLLMFLSSSSAAELTREFG
jgi:peptidoglycan hydrolase CwlO-like protein